MPHLVCFGADVHIHFIDLHIHAIPLHLTACLNDTEPVMCNLEVSALSTSTRTKKCVCLTATDVYAPSGEGSVRRSGAYVMKD
jgi:hypothetical protein